jgi:hypothetical protein
MTSEPSLKIINMILNAQAQNVLSFPLAAALMSALTQAETTVELTNRVYESIFQRSPMSRHSVLSRPNGESHG